MDFRQADPQTTDRTPGAIAPQRPQSVLGLNLTQFVGYRYTFTVITTLLALVATVLFYRVIATADHEMHQRAVGRQAQQIAEALADVMSTYQQVLRATAGLVHAAGVPTLEVWRQFTSHLSLEREFPGIQGLGYVEVIEKDKIAARVIEEQRRGRPEFQWRPPGDRDIYTSIIYLEPDNFRNRRAIGFDMYSEERRRRAMQAARDSGEPVVSSIVTLVQELSEGTQPGGLAYLALYDGGVIPPTVDERRKALRGYVYGVFRWGDFIHHSLQKSLPDIFNRVQLQVYAIEDGNDRRPLYIGQYDRPPSEYTQTLFTNIGGRTWELRVTALPEFAAKFDHLRPQLVLIAGLIFTALLTGITGSLAYSRERAFAAKEALEREVRQRRLAQDQVQLANSELIHRVKNTLAIVSAVASQTARHSTSLPEFTRAFRDRLVALAAVHDLLRPDPSYSPDLGTLARDLLRAFTGEIAANRLQFTGPRVPIPRNDAVLLSLLINELATNATKYGAWSVPEGSVRIEWSVDQSDEGDFVTLTWAEHGGPRPKGDLQEGFGTQVMRSIERGLSGSLKRAFDDDGLRLSLRFPLPRTIGRKASA